MLRGFMPPLTATPPLFGPGLARAAPRGCSPTFLVPAWLGIAVRGPPLPLLRRMSENLWPFPPLPNMDMKGSYKLYRWLAAWGNPGGTGHLIGLNHNSNRTVLAPLLQDSFFSKVRILRHFQEPS